MPETETCAIPRGKRLLIGPDDADASNLDELVDRMQASEEWVEGPPIEVVP